jgi:hypothetical protein
VAVTVGPNLLGDATPPSRSREDRLFFFVAKKISHIEKLLEQ